MTRRAADDPVRTVPKATRDRRAARRAARIADVQRRPGETAAAYHRRVWDGEEVRACILCGRHYPASYEWGGRRDEAGHDSGSCLEYCWVRSSTPSRPLPDPIERRQCAVCGASFQAFNPRRRLCLPVWPASAGTASPCAGSPEAEADRIAHRRARQRAYTATGRRGGRWLPRKNDGGTEA